MYRLRETTKLGKEMLVSIEWRRRPEVEFQSIIGDHKVRYRFASPALPGLPESFVPPLEEVRVRLSFDRPRRPDPLVVYTLETVTQHGSVGLLEDRAPDLDGVVA
jgi:hypothetical protein